MADSGKKSKKVVSDGAETAAEQFRALGDATRLRIVWYLRRQAQTAAHIAAMTEGEGMPESRTTAANVTDLCRAVTGSDKLNSTFSHHLKELRHAGLIGVEKDGKNRAYYLLPGALEAVSEWVCGPSRNEETASG
jgi:DNA-binding transcriptional ArsR family regulator